MSYLSLLKKRFTDQENRFPLINVVFHLLIFLLVSYRLSGVENLDLQFPAFMFIVGYLFGSFSDLVDDFVKVLSLFKPLPRLDSEEG
jgi:hypothetical protein